MAEHELEGVFTRLLDVARELTAAKYAAIGILDDARETLADFITAGIDPSAHSLIGDLPRGRGVLGLLISNPEPLRMADVGAHIRSYGFPQGHPAMTSFLGVPILIRGEAWGNLYLTDKLDGEFDEADEEAAVVLASWAAIAVENARLYRETDLRRAELERSVRALEATSEIARAVGGETQLERVLELIAKRSRALVDAAGVAILLEDGDDFVIAATAGEIPRRITGSRVTKSGSVAGRVVAAGRPERVSDIPSSLRFALGDLGVNARSGMFVPLHFRGANLGVIEAFDRADGPEFRVEDERMLLAAAASAATAVATAQSVERDRLRRTLRAAEEERRRWARELHDETLQALGGLRVVLSSARRSSDLASLQAALDSAVEQLGDEIANLRSLITELRPAALDELGLAPALDALIERVQSAHGLEITATVALIHEGGLHKPRLDSDIETTVYRVVQESLTNVARHAHAEHVDVDVIERGEEILLTVRDDGKGFDQDTPAAGFGLTGMRERIALAGGHLEVSSSPAGTTVEAAIPTGIRVRQTA
ncbi:MAG TPA: GAF domain-containing sensor histidine kinase [Solirubrobacteraceae bacterium]|nr:GAF domain-containing sensor histidine kinase [Solirubrobacteraceae bacterium]